MGLIKRIRENTPTKDEAVVWARVANSDKYSVVRRCRALLQLFDRNAPQGMTLGELADVLKKPSWLKRENILEIVGSANNLRLTPASSGESVFCLTFRLPPSDWSGVYLRVSAAEGVPTKDLLFDTLDGKKTNARRFAIAGTVVYPGTLGDLAYVTAQLQGSAAIYPAPATSHLDSPLGGCVCDR